MILRDYLATKDLIELADKDLSKASTSNEQLSEKIVQIKL